MVMMMTIMGVKMMMVAVLVLDDQHYMVVKYCAQLNSQFGLSFSGSQFGDHHPVDDGDDDNGHWGEDNEVGQEHFDTVCDVKFEEEKKGMTVMIMIKMVMMMMVMVMVVMNDPQPISLIGNTLF